MISRGFSRPTGVQIIAIARGSEQSRKLELKRDQVELDQGEAKSRYVIACMLAVLA